MTREEIEAKVWRACDIMRRDDNTKGIMKYMEQLSWLLFLKVFEAIEDQYETEARLASRAYDRILDVEWRWSTWSSRDWPGEQLIKFIVEQLLPHLRSLSGTTQRDTIATIFRGISVVMKSPYNLKDVITIVNEIDFHRPDDVHTISVAYEQLLSKMGSEAGLSGEFYTPRPIVRFMVDVVNPKIGETVYDPFSGSAGFLVEAYAHMRLQTKLTVDQEQLLQSGTFFGQESGDLSTLLGVMNMILHGVAAPNILRRNTLEQDVRNIPPSDRHDLILTNPPFGGKENRQIQQNFPVQSQSTELLALQHILKKLKPGGRCGVVVPEGLLFRADAFAQVKKDLVENYNISAIVSLPSGAFTNAGIKTNLLFFERTGPTREVWYYELTPSDGVRFKKGNPVTDETFDECRGFMKARQVSSRSWILSVEDIVERKYDMTAKNPNRDGAASKVAPTETLARLTARDFEIADTLRHVRQLLMSNGSPRGWDEKTLLEVAEINPRRDSLSGIDDAMLVSFVPMSAVDERTATIFDRIERPFSEVRRGYTFFREGDVLFAKITPCMQNGKAAIATNLKNGIGFGSTEFHVLRPLSGVLPEWLLYFLRRESFREEATRSFTGSVGQQRVPESFLEKQRIPLPPLPEQQRIVSRLAEVQGQVEKVRTLTELAQSDLVSLSSSVLEGVFRAPRD